MSVNFSKGRTELNSLYDEYEPQVRPMLVSMSNRLSSTVPGISFDDAMQEGRLAMLYALDKFEPDKCAISSPKPYIRSAVTNTFRTIANQAKTQKRMYHVRDDEVMVPVQNVSLDARWGDDESSEYAHQPESATPSPDIPLQFAETIPEIDAFVASLRDKLNGTDLAVFECMVTPSQSFLRMLYTNNHTNVRIEDGMYVADDEFIATNAEIRGFLGIDKAKIDWCMYKIRNAFMTMAASADSPYSDLLAGKRWPAIHVTDGYDDDFVRITMQRRGLGDKLINVESKSAGGYERIIRNYAWGSVMFASNGTERHTMVLEGRFNPLFSVVYGQTGASLTLPLAWANKMATAIKKASK